MISESDDGDNDSYDSCDSQPLVINVTSTARHTSQAATMRPGATQAQMSLRTYGYARVQNMSQTDRRYALIRAVMACEDVRKVVGILHWCEKVNRVSHPQASGIFQIDQQWLLENRHAIQRHIDVKRRCQVNRDGRASMLEMENTVKR